MEVAHLSFGSFGDVVVWDGLRDEACLDLRALRTVEDHLMRHDRRQRFRAEAYHGDRQREISPGYVPAVLHELLSHSTHRSRSIGPAPSYRGNRWAAGTKLHRTWSRGGPISGWFDSNWACHWGCENNGHQRFGIGAHDRPNIA